MKHSTEDCDYVWKRTRQFIDDVEKHIDQEMKRYREAGMEVYKIDHPLWMKLYQYKKDVNLW